MADPLTYGVRHPRLLAFTREPDDCLMLAAGVGRDRLYIVASRERWAEVFAAVMSGRVPDPVATAREMFVRGEIPVEELEKALDGHRS